MAAGGNYSLALKANGTVWAWGSNTNLQCGRSGASSPTPTQVQGFPPSTTIVKIAAGLTHSVALAANGAVYTWGGNANCQLGMGAGSDWASPRSPIGGASDISAGGGSYHTLALVGTAVKAWGSNNYGQSGGSSYSSPVITPTTVTGLPAIIAITTGTDSSFAVTSGGTSVYGWGRGSPNSYGPPMIIPGLSNANVKSLVAGNGFALAVKTNNTVVGWGSNFYGSLGLGPVASASPPQVLNTLAPVRVLAAGSNSTVAITTSGSIFAWGSNATGALGFGTSTQKNVPIQLLLENLPDVSTIAAGGSHNLITHVLDPNAATHPYDTAWAWGLNTSGQLGVNHLLPCAEPLQIVEPNQNAWLHPLFSLNPVYAPRPVAGAGNDFSLFVRADGTVVSAGQNSYGQLGNPASVSRSTAFIPVMQTNPASQLTNIASVAAGRSHGLAVTSGGNVRAWGYGLYGQLGNGLSPSQQYSPVWVANASGGYLSSVYSVAAGENHSVALKANGEVLAWGQNSYGQVGNTTSADRRFPNIVGLTSAGGTALSGVTSIAAGLRHNLARKLDNSGHGVLVAWGYNTNGQLGDNSTTQRSTPVSVPTLIDVDAVAAGYAHSIALKSDGTVWAWGRNTEGQLGDGTNLQRNAPVQVLGLSGVLAIAAGDYHNLALKADGTLASWGANNLDQLGTGLSMAQLTPLIVPGVNALYGAPGVVNEQPAPGIYGVGEPFTLHLTLNPYQDPSQARSIAKIAYFSDGFPLALAGAPPTYSETLYPPVTVSTDRYTELSSDTWGDLHITATSYDADNNPSFPSQPVTIHILPPIYLTATLAAANTVHLTWTTVPGPGMTFRIERRLPGDNPTMLVDGLSALSYSDTPTPFSPEYLYRVIGFIGTQKVAVSAETPVTFTDTDGDGLPDVWEAEWGLNPTAANASYTWLAGVGLSAQQLFTQGANRADYPPINPSDWTGQKRLHAYYYPAAGGRNGIVWEDWEGNAPLAATVQVERENADGTWEPISGATAPVADGFVEWAAGGAGGGPGDNFRLRGGVTSCETLRKVRMMARNTEIQRDHPGIYDPATNRYYLRRDWGSPGDNNGWEQWSLANGTYNSAGTVHFWNGSETTTYSCSSPLEAPGTVTETSVVSGTPASENHGTVTGTYDIVIGHWTNPVNGLDEEYSEATMESFWPAGKEIQPVPSSGLENATYTNEYSFADFYADTLIMLKPLLSKNAGRRESRLDDLPPYPAGAWTLRQYAELPYCTLSPDEPQRNFWRDDAPHVIARRYSSANRIQLKWSEYWIECNDCEPAPAVTAIEIESLDGPIPGAPASQTVKAIISFRPGSQPGKPTKTDPKTSNYPSTNGNNTLRPLPMAMMVDGNRDGAMSFDNSSADQTTAQKPYRFWLNNDHDVFNTVDGNDTEWDDASDTATWKDCYYTSIYTTRDLEDFTRLRITFKGLTELVKKTENGAYLYNAFLEWRAMDGAQTLPAADGAPDINVYQEKQPDVRPLYLEDKVVASHQRDTPYDTWIGGVRPGQPMDLFAMRPALRTALSESDPTVNLLFCGKTAGRGQLILTIKKGTQLIGQYPPVYIELLDIKDMYERWTVGDGNGAPPTATAQLCQRAMASGYSSPGHNRPFGYQPSDPEDKKYILYVHGWNVTPQQADRDAKTAYKRLFWQGYKGRFGTFQYPTAYDFGTYFNEDTMWKKYANSALAGADPTNYDRGEWSGWRSAPGLVGVLAQINGSYAGQLYVFAHSGGNMVVGEALRLAAQQNRGQLVKAYVASQAALPSHCYDGQRAQGLRI